MLTFIAVMLVLCFLFIVLGIWFAIGAVLRLVQVLERVERTHSELISMTHNLVVIAQRRWERDTMENG